MELFARSTCTLHKLQVIYQVLCLFVKVQVLTAPQCAIMYMIYLVLPRFFAPMK